MDIRKDGEKELLRLIREGDANARYLMYKQYVRYLAAVCSRYVNSDEDVKDVLQEAFLRIFSSVDDFVYRGEGSLKAWMSRIVLNESLKWMKQKCRFDLVEIGNEQLDIPDEDPDTDGIPTDVIYMLIRSLPDGYRTVFNLYVVEGKSHKEIAEILGIKESSSASQLHHAKAMLAEKITRFRNSKDIEQ